MNEVLRYLIKSSAPLIEETMLEETINLPQHKWQSLTEEVKGILIFFILSLYINFIIIDKI